MGLVFLNLQFIIFHLQKFQNNYNNSFLGLPCYNPFFSQGYDAFLQIGFGKLQILIGLNAFYLHRTLLHIQNYFCNF